MPVHPIDACYCHILEAGHGNIMRLSSAGDIEGIQIEVTHLDEVTKILSDFLLYHPNDERWSDSEHERYWNSIRLQYIEAAPDRSIYEYFNAWDFLALATRRDLREHLREEEQVVRLRIEQAEHDAAPNPA